MRREIKMNKRGAELGKIIMSFPVLIGIFVVMGIFIALSVAMANSKTPDMPSVYSSFNKGNLLLEEIEFDGKQVIVFDALTGLEREDNIALVNFQIALEKYLIEQERDNICIYIFDSNEGDNLILRLKYYFDEESKMILRDGHDYLSMENLLNLNYPQDVQRLVFSDGFDLGTHNRNYGNYDSSISYSFEDKEFTLKYYYGKCLGSEK